jgi:hypothetical protein
MRQDVAAGDGHVDAGVTALAWPTRAGLARPLASTSNRGASRL